jgi:predicted RNase H-like nuclease (RuvC/YqgF family)
MEEIKNFEKQIKEFALKTLPSQIGEQLQELINQGKKDARDTKRLNKENEQLQKDIETIEKALIEKTNQLKNIEEREKAIDENIIFIDKARLDLEYKERELKVKELEIRLEESEKRAETVTEFTHGLVRNTTFRKVLEKTDHTPGHYDQHGTWINDTYKNDTKTETKDAE